MHRMERTRTMRTARWQAAVLLCVVAGDGVLTYALGGPVWLLPLYAAAGGGVAAGWLWFAGRGRPAATAPVPAATAAPTRPAARRALGYIRVDEGDDGALNEPTRQIEQSCLE